MKKFISFETLDPVAAQHLLPGVKLQVSRRTFAEIAAQKFTVLKARQAASPTPAIDLNEAREVHAAALAAPLGTDDD